MRDKVMLMVALALFTACGDDGGTDTPDTTPPTPPKLVVDITSIDFPALVIGESATPVRVDIRNEGGESSGPIFINFEGSSSFFLANDLCRPLPPLGSCPIYISYSPNGLGAHGGSVVAAGQEGGRVDIELSGRGLQPPGLTLDVSVANLGDVVVDETGATTSTITVGNTGDVPVGPLSIAFSGQHPDDFEFVGDCLNGTLEAHGECTLTATFTPSDVGQRSVIIDVSAPGLRQLSGVLRGNGLEPAKLIAVSEQGFGSVVAGGTGATTLLTITNAGASPSGELAVNVIGSDADQFAILGCNGRTIEPGAFCRIEVRFAPTVLRPITAELEVTSDPGGTLLIALSGIGVASQLTIDPTLHTFDSVAIGALTDTVTFTVKNLSSRVSGNITSAIVGDSGEFRITNDLCKNNSLQPNAFCRISVAFNPTRAGPAFAELVTTSVASGEVTAALQGTGLAPPEITITPTTFGFPPVQLGRSSALETFTIKNIGGEPSGLVDVQLAGLDPGEFELVGNTCLARLLPSRSCAVQIRFTPTTIQLSNATIIAQTSPGGTVAAAVTGEGISPDQLRISPESFEFPATPIGVSVTETFVIDNDSPASTGVIIVAKAGATPNEFALSDDCNTLGPHATCTLTVTFTPRADGARSAHVIITASPGGGTRLDLSGLGTVP